MNNDIILFPEFEQLKLEVEKLRTELSMLVLERDSLLLIECKNIEAAYMLQLGSLEYKVYKAYCLYLRLKRKAVLIQSRVNRQERIDLIAIDCYLDEEFAEYQAHLDEQIRKMNEAIDRNNAKSLSQEDTAEIKKLYRSIVKALHPDLHPDFTEEKKELFHKAVTAYENGDLRTIQIISAMVIEDNISDFHIDAIESLRQERERLISLISSIRNDILVIKAKFPYTMKEILNDPSRVCSHKFLTNRPDCGIMKPWKSRFNNTKGLKNTFLSKEEMSVSPISK